MVAHVTTTPEQPPRPSAASTMYVVNNFTTYRPPVRPPNGTWTGVVPHPSQGGDAYAPEFRDQAYGKMEVT